MDSYLNSFPMFNFEISERLIAERVLVLGLEKRLMT